MTGPKGNSEFCFLEKVMPSRPKSQVVTSQVRVESIFLFDVFGSFVFNCCVKIMHQRHKNRKI